jgi:hypothetical protein
VPSTTRGTVVELHGTEATLEMEDGTRAVADVPEMIHVEVGMAVAVTDVGDGKPIYQWGV